METYEQLKKIICSRCGWAQDRDLLAGKISCGYRYCIAREIMVRTMSLRCFLFYSLEAEN